MSFGEQVTATLIGTVAGFTGSLLLFWIREKVGRCIHEKALVDNLFYELDYNIALFRKYEDLITESIESTGHDNRNVYLNIDYEYIARFFAIQFYQSGLLRKYLHHEDMKRWNDFMIALQVGGQAYVLNQLEAWRKGALGKEDIFAALNMEREHIRDAIRMTVHIKERLNSRTNE